MQCMHATRQASRDLTRTNEPSQAATALSMASADAALAAAQAAHVPGSDAMRAHLKRQKSELHDERHIDLVEFHRALIM